LSVDRQAELKRESLNQPAEQAKEYSQGKLGAALERVASSHSQPAVAGDRMSAARYRGLSLQSRKLTQGFALAPPWLLFCRLPCRLFEIASHDVSLVQFLVQNLQPEKTEKISIACDRPPARIGMMIKHR